MVGAEAGAAVSVSRSAISSVVISGIGTEAEGGTGVDTKGAAESKTAGVVAGTGWTVDWVRAGVHRVVP